MSLPKKVPGPSALGAEGDIKRVSEGGDAVKMVLDEMGHVRFMKWLGKTSPRGWRGWW